MDQASPLSENLIKTDKMTGIIETSIRNASSKDNFKELNGEVFAGALACLF